MTRTTHPRAPRGIDWDAQPLGREPDTVIAVRLDVTPHAVFNARVKRGIPAFERYTPRPPPSAFAPSPPSRRGPRGIDWDAEPLGRESDASIAARLGVKATSVWMARFKRGIPRFAPTAARAAIVAAASAPSTVGDECILCGAPRGAAHGFACPGVRAAVRPPMHAFDLDTAERVDLAARGIPCRTCGAARAAPCRALGDGERLVDTHAGRRDDAGFPPALKGFAQNPAAAAVVGARGRRARRAS